MLSTQIARGQIGEASGSQDRLADERVHKVGGKPRPSGWSQCAGYANNPEGHAHKTKVLTESVGTLRWEIRGPGASLSLLRTRQKPSS
jgi:hypothetical protein